MKGGCYVRQYICVSANYFGLKKRVGTGQCRRSVAKQRIQRTAGEILEGIPDSFQVDSWLRDNHNGNKGRYVLLDSERDDVKDSNDRKFDTRGYSTEQILDSGNNPIRSRAIFVKN